MATEEMPGIEAGEEVNCKWSICALCRPWGRVGAQWTAAELLPDPDLLKTSLPLRNAAPVINDGDELNYDAAEVGVEKNITVSGC